MASESLTRALDVCVAVALRETPARVGVDLTLISEVADSIDTFGATYLERIYTAGELADCGGDASRLAARFAAKEAATKVLAPRDAPGWWRDIETVRSASGACELRLHHAAAAAAASTQLSGWSVSLTHEGDYAAAVVIAFPAAERTVIFPQEAKA